MLGPPEISYAARSNHRMYGTLGQLLYEPGSAESVQYSNNNVKVVKGVKAINKKTGEKVMYDNKIGKWIPYDETKVCTTYSLAPEPKNVKEELEHFIRGGGLIKHKFIWSTSNTLSFDQFEKLKSRRNKEFHGRFTLTPHLPMANRRQR